MTARTGLGYECETDHAQTNCSSLADQCRFNEHSVYISKRSLEYVLALCQPLALRAGASPDCHQRGSRDVIDSSRDRVPQRASMQGALDVHWLLPRLGQRPPPTPRLNSCSQNAAVLQASPFCCFGLWTTVRYHPVEQYY